MIMGPNCKRAVLICLIIYSAICQELPEQDKIKETRIFDEDQEVPINQFSMLTTPNESNIVNDTDIDPQGYILYCPCMGRFGNQAEQLIGALAFGKGLNRTLVLPPFIVYPSYSPASSERVKFTKWFEVKPLTKYHRVMTMENFMKEVAPKIWPKGKRFGFCYSFRDGKTCGMKEGNPFGPFWDHFGVSFDGYVAHPGILWDTNNKVIANEWQKRFPPSKYLVYAFQGAPGDYPSRPENHHIQKYIKFSKYINERSDDFIKEEMNGEPYVAIHLRNGEDMLNVCDEVKSGQFKKIFCSEQCTGYREERKLSYEMCAPSKKEIVRKVKEYLKKASAKRLFIGTDNDSMLKMFSKALRKMKVTFHTYIGNNESDDPIVDIAIMSKADYFIGNCVSSFTAFVNKQRTANNRPVAFFGLD